MLCPKQKGRGYLETSNRVKGPAFIKIPKQKEEASTYTRLQFDLIPGNGRAVTQDTLNAILRLS